MKKKIIISITTILIIISAIYISYGFVSARITNNELAKKQTFTNQKLEIEYSDGTETLTSNNTSFIPGSAITKTFTIKNTGNIKLNFKINLTNVTNTFTRKEDITYELYLEDELLISNIYPSANTTIAYNQTINKNETKNYTLKIIYNDSEENQIIDSGATINGKISFDQQINNLTNLKILGNSIQSGTPSIDTPVEIESVGDKTVNLLEYGLPRMINAMTYLKNHLKQTLIKLEPGKYTLSFKEITNATKYRLSWVVFTDEEATNEITTPTNDYFDISIDIGYYYNGGHTTFLPNDDLSVSNKNFEITVSNECYVSFIITNGDTTDETEVIEPQLEAGTTATSYEPYGKYKIPVTVRSINLYKPTRVSAEALRTPSATASLQNNVGTSINTTDATLNEFIVTQSSIDETTTVNDNYTNGYFCLETGESIFKHNQKYTISFDCEVLNNLLNDNTMLIGPNFVIDKYDYIDVNNERIFKNFTYIINDAGNDNFIEIRNKGKSLKISNIMITDVGDSTEYTPYIEPFTQYIYLDEPLRKIGEYEDYIDLEEGKVYRYVEVIDDTGTLSLEESLRGLETPIVEDIDLPSVYSLNPDLKIVADTTVNATIEKE